MASSNDDHGIVGGDLIQIAAKRNALLLDLRFVPVAVCDDEIVGLALFDPRGDSGQQFVHGANARQIDARTTASVVQVAVLESGNNRAACAIVSLVTLSVASGIGSSSACSCARLRPRRRHTGVPVAVADREAPPQAKM